MCFELCNSLFFTQKFYCNPFLLIQGRSTLRKICKWYDIWLVIFVVNTRDLVKHNWFYPCCLKKSWNLLAGVNITDLCIFFDILAIFQAWNICFALSSSCLPQYMFYCHTFLWIHSRSPSHVPYLALLPPDGTCVALVLPSPFSLSFLPCLSLLVPVNDLEPECRLNSHKIILTFRGPCIVIYSCNKSQRDTLFLKFILVKTLHVSERFTVHHLES